VIFDGGHLGLGVQAANHAPLEERAALHDVREGKKGLRIAHRRDAQYGGHRLSHSAADHNGSHMSPEAYAPLSIPTDTEDIADRIGLPPQDAPRIDEYLQSGGAVPRS